MWFRLGASGVYGATSITSSIAYTVSHCISALLSSPKWMRFYELHCITNYTTSPELFRFTNKLNFQWKSRKPFVRSSLKSWMKVKLKQMVNFFIPFLEKRTKNVERKEKLCVTRFYIFYINSTSTIIITASFRVTMSCVGARTPFYTLRFARKCTRAHNYIQSILNFVSFFYFYHASSLPFSCIHTYP